MYDMQDFNALHYVVYIEQKEDFVGTKEKIATISTQGIEVNVAATVEALVGAGFDPHAKVAHCYHEEVGDRLCDDGGCTVSAYDLACERKQYRLAATLRSCWHQTCSPIVLR
ncbi:hypothetical protein K4K59_012084 [Colletotrichum sp. SAR11_240]|nr:hypothetical protein K4K59_012084 [Colletotrichum sp. SAR11_240]